MIADRIRAALSAPDPTAFAALLHLTVDLDGPDGSWTAQSLVRLAGNLVIDIRME